MSAAGAAFGVIGAGLPLIAGFIVLDAIAGTVKCTHPGCGEEMHHSKQASHSKAHQSKGEHTTHKTIQRHEFGGDMDSWLGLG
jgi:hypothetical protein